MAPSHVRLARVQLVRAPLGAAEAPPVLSDGERGRGELTVTDVERIAQQMDKLADKFDEAGKANGEKLEKVLEGVSKLAVDAGRTDERLRAADRELEAHKREEALRHDALKKEIEAHKADVQRKHDDHNTRLVTVERFSWKATGITTAAVIGVSGFLGFLGWLVKVALGH